MGPLGSYKFSPPPTYSQSFEDRRLATSESSPTTNRQQQQTTPTLQRQPSEIPSFGRQMSDRYVPEKKRVVYVEEGCDQLEEPTEERVDGTGDNNNENENGGGGA